MHATAASRCQECNSKLEPAPPAYPVLHFLVERGQNNGMHHLNLTSPAIANNNSANNNNNFHRASHLRAGQAERSDKHVLLMAVLHAQSSHR